MHHQVRNSELCHRPFKDRAIQWRIRNGDPYVPARREEPLHRAKSANGIRGVLNDMISRDDVKLGVAQRLRMYSSSVP